MWAAVLVWRKPHKRSKNSYKSPKCHLFPTLKGLGSIDPTDPVYIGMIGMHGTRAANVAVQECDFIIGYCGARFDDRVTGKLDSFAPHAKVIHCDIDAAEINKLPRCQCCSSR